MIFFLLLFSRITAQPKQSGADTTAQKIIWYSFAQAYEMNKKEPRKLFIDVYTDWCGWCKKMDKETFTNPVISDYMSTHYYCVKLNAEQKDTIVIDGSKFVNPNPGTARSVHQLAAELLKGKMSYPSLVFMDGKNQLLTVVQGYQPPQGLEPMLRFFGDDSYLTQKWEEFLPSFRSKLPPQQAPK